MHVNIFFAKNKAEYMPAWHLTLNAVTSTLSFSWRGSVTWMKWCWRGKMDSRMRKLSWPVNEFEPILIAWILTFLTQDHPKLSPIFVELVFYFNFRYCIFVFYLVSPLLILLTWLMILRKGKEIDQVIS